MYDNYWWYAAREQLLQYGQQSPCYVYDLAQVKRAAAAILTLPVDQVFYASKANGHADILRTLYAAGIGIECVSPGEVDFARSAIASLSDQRTLFTPNFAPKSEYAWASKQSFHLTLDNLYPLQHWPELFQQKRLMLRFDPGAGAGHHEHVKTGGDESKFGIRLDQAALAQELALAAGAQIMGVHAHAGSGILASGHWAELAKTLTGLLRHFPEADVVNLGGGLGVPVKLGDEPVDLSRVAESLRAVRTRFSDVHWWMEPGRFLVAECGVLLARVTQTKGKGDFSYIGIDAGMNSLIRPALYAAHHPIINLTRIDEPATETVHIVGPICESADKLAMNVKMPHCQEGDVLLIANAGAYGHVMSSHYNRRAPASEIVLGN